jgi:hypothetical protein
VGQTRRELLKSTSQPAVVETLAPHHSTGRTATDVLSPPLTQSSPRVIALSNIASCAVDTHTSTIEFVQNRTNFAQHARSGSSFAGDVLPEQGVVRNESAFFRSQSTAIN